MNYSILLDVKKPDAVDYNNIEKYDKLVRISESITARNKNSRLLAESNLLLPLSHGLHDVLDALKSLKDLPYTYTVLTEGTLWHEAVNII